MGALLAAALLWGTTAAAIAPPVPVGELDSEAHRWAGRQVTVVGELIGDYSPRAEVVWVQLNDDPYVDDPLAEGGALAGSNVGIGVRMPPDLFRPEEWGSPGGFGTRGPLVEVTGTFRSGGAEEAGDTFIDAETVRLVEAARPLPTDDPDAAVVVAGALGVLAGAAALGWSRWRRINPR